MYAALPIPRLLASAAGRAMWRRVATLLAALRGIRGGDSVRARVVRDAPGDTLEVRFVVDSLTYERIPGVTVEYGAVRSNLRHLVRTVVTRPERSGVRRLPGGRVHTLALV
jgi:hypothetical protein